MDYQPIFDQCQAKTKPLYRVDSAVVTDGFIHWFELTANFSDRYIEIPSNETTSGHAEIIEF